MKYWIVLFISLTVFAGFTDTASAARVPNLVGSIVVQTDGEKGLWYISPRDNSRYYAKNSAEFLKIASKQSIGISNRDIKKIPTSTKQKADKKLVQRLKGMFIIQVQDKGQIWYVHPTSGVRYHIKDAKTAEELIQKIGIKEKSDSIAEYVMNPHQNIQDPIFNDVAYVAYSQGSFTHAHHADTLLPFASLSKLMTAIVLLERPIDWDKKIIITQDQIEYPWQYADKGTTSEIDLKTGDTISIRDLWNAMLIASSNQSAIILVDAISMDRQSFIQRMNQKAKEIGMNNTVFFDPTGLDPRTIGTAKDMALLADAAFQQLDIVRTSATRDTLVASVMNDSTERKVSIKNRNYSLLAFEPEASKTGFLTEAQRTVALKKNNAIIVVLHARSMNERNTVIQSLINDISQAQVVAVH